VDQSSLELHDHNLERPIKDKEKKIAGTLQEEFFSPKF
jgi:hypothetical protein